MLTVPSEPVTVPVWLSKGTLCLPTAPASHVIMVGPGTGCAPFRAYIEERVANQLDTYCV